MRQRILREEKPFVTHHAALAAKPQDQRLIVEVAAPSIPAVVGFSAAGERRVQADNAGRLPLLEPGGQLLAVPDAQSAEIENLKLAAAPGTQSRHAFERFQIVVERRTDKNPDVKIVTTVGCFPVVKPVHEPLEARERQRAALARL
jgi:hypothetical protein